MDTNPISWGLRKTLSSQDDPNSDIQDGQACLCLTLWVALCTVHKRIRYLCVYLIHSWLILRKSEYQWKQISTNTHLLSSRVSLPEEPPSAPPQNVIASGRTNQSIMIQWQPPPESHQNGILRGYVIRWDMSTSCLRSSIRCYPLQSVLITVDCILLICTDLRIAVIFIFQGYSGILFRRFLPVINGSEVEFLFLRMF